MKNGPTVLLMVLDAVGATTLEYLLAHSARKVHLPHLCEMGLGNILSEKFRDRIAPRPGAQLSLALTQASAYPDSTIGHREMVGVVDPRKYQLFPDGFPQNFVRALEKEIGRGVMFNRMAGGMEAIEENRELHEKTGRPILYASKCDPVLQLAMNEEIIPIPEQHRIVDASFALALRMGLKVTRAIGRSYVMKDGAIFRTPNRHDCTLPLERPTLIGIARGRGVRTVSVGKAAELVGADFDDTIKLTDPKLLDPALGFRFVDGKKRDTNPYSIQGTINALVAARNISRPRGTFVFANCVDADSLFGHTRDIEGALRSIEEFDRLLPRVTHLLAPGDMIMITADHGMEHREDYGYHSLEPLPMLAERVGVRFDLNLFTRGTLALAGYLAAQVFGCGDEYVETCALGKYLRSGRGGRPGRGQIGGAMRRTITFKGNPLTLVGRAVKEGDGAPDFRVLSGDLKEVRLSQFKDKVKIITSFPSLDTPVCDMQVKEFNKRAISLSEEVVILGISNDLPFAQKRFCEDNDIRNVVVLSDYRYSSFGINYGLLIKELKLLARAVCILDRDNIVRYIQIVGELTSPPDYDRAIENLREVIAKPALPAHGAQPARCAPCEGGVAAFPKDVAEKLAARIKGWELVEGVKLKKEFTFKDFVEAKYFLDLLAMVAEDQGHHPVLTLLYNKVRVTLATHAAGGLTENDFIMAGIIDEVGSEQ